MGQREEVEIFSSNVRLSGWFFPAQKPGRTGCYVLCPGFTGTKYGRFYEPYTEHLNGLGYSVLLFDYRGWGASEGSRGDVYPLEQVDDIRSCLSYLETRADVDPDRMGLLGMSFGGGHAIYAAAVDERVRCTVAISPVGDGRTWLKRMRRAYEWEQFLADLDEDRKQRVLTGRGRRVPPSEGIMLATPERGVDGSRVKGNLPADLDVETSPLACGQAILEYRPLAVVDRIAPRGLLIVYFEHDAVVPGEDHATPLFEAAREPKRLVRLTSSSHYAGYLECFPTIKEELEAWTARYLEPAPIARGTTGGVRERPETATSASMERTDGVRVG